MKKTFIVKCAVFALASTMALGSSSARAVTAEVNLGANGSGYGNTGGSVNGKINVGAPTRSSVQPSVQASSTYGAPNSLLKVNVNTSGNGSTTAENAASAYAEVASVDSSSDNAVVVTYERPAKLFGFINVYITEKATVSVDTETKTPEVKVSKSWWSFLASSDMHSSEFSSAIASRIASDVSVSADGSLSATAKSRLVADIQEAAEATYGTAASGSMR